MKFKDAKKRFTEIDGISATKHLEYEERKNQVSAKLSKALENVEKTKEQQKRLQKVIEICFINKDYNEKWIQVSPKNPPLTYLEAQFLDYQPGCHDRKPKKAYRDR